MFKKTMVLAMLGLLGAAPAFAHEGRSPEAQKEWKTERMNRLAERLGLDAAGEARLQEIFQKFRGQAAPLMKEARETRLALQEELAAKTPNEAKVSALSGKLQEAREQMRAIGQQRSLELKAALTPTQYAKLMMSRHRFGRGFHKHESQKD
jgi:Spy/CpxP family protein refolding chaperone